MSAPRPHSGTVLPVHTYFHEVAVTPTWFFAIVAGFFGAALASFLGVVGERVPRHETLGGRSHCVCGADLGGTNIPIVGWLVLRGRARCCGARIPVRYVLAEAYLAASWAGIAALRLVWWLWAPLLVVSAGIVLAASWRRPPAEQG